jgi:hypothetical protein
MNVSIFRWYDNLSIWPRIFLSTLSASLPFYFAAFLSSSFADAYKATTKTGILIHFSVFIVLIIVIVFIYRLLSFYHAAYKEEAAEEHTALFRAFTLCDRRIIKQHEIVKKSFSEPDTKLKNLLASVDRIQEIVDDAYSTFESIYGNQERSGERIDFEVTFMTHSYADDKLTIPCSANRSGRKPRSMVLREKNPKIYDDTETAKVYNAKRPNPIIVSDTLNSTYVELYPSQKERIKSSIIYPVLSEDNVVLGTLVIHCDRTGFFTYEKEKFWSDLLEVFSKRISVEKVKLDLMDQITRSGTLNFDLQHQIVF